MLDLVFLKKQKKEWSILNQVLRNLEKVRKKPEEFISKSLTAKNNMLVDSLRKKLVESQKSQNEIALNTLRLLITEAKNKEISLRAEQKEVGDEDILKIIKKQIKNRSESIPMYEKAGRPETAQKEKLEVEFLQGLLAEYFPNEAGN